MKATEAGKEVYQHKNLVRSGSVRFGSARAGAGAGAGSDTDAVCGRGMRYADIFHSRNVVGGVYSTRSNHFFLALSPLPPLPHSAACAFRDILSDTYSPRFTRRTGQVVR